MKYIHIRDFKAGMDRTRDMRNGDAGSLWTLKNAHITRGGDIERAKRFAPVYSLPAGQTVGYAALNGRHYVFADHSVSLPSDVLLQTLRHPNDEALVEILDVEPFDGRLYVVARFADGTIHHFYDQERVDAWDDLLVAGSYTSLNDVAARLAKEINNDPRYTAAADGIGIEVTGAPNVAYTFTALLNGAAAATFTSALIEAAGQPQSEIAPTAGADVEGGSSGTGGVKARGFIYITRNNDVSGGVGTIQSVVVDGVELLNAPITTVGSDPETQPAADVAQSINDATTEHGFTATVTDFSIQLTAPDEGDALNGVRPTVFTTGGALANASAFGGGVTSRNQLKALWLDDVNLIDAPIPYTTRPGFVAAVIAAVNARTGITNVIASQQGNGFIFTGAAGVGSAFNGKAPQFEIEGDIQIEDVTVFSGGRDDGTLSPQTVQFDISGAFDGRDKYIVRLNDREFVMSADRTGIGLTAWTYKNKLHSTGLSLLRFSALNNPTNWRTGLGAGFINVSNQRKGDRPLVGAAEFQDLAAMFSREDIKLFSLNEDDDLNNYRNSVDNTGTIAARSIIPYGNTDVFYLDTTGVRSLRSRNVTNLAYAEDVGTPIDPFAQELVAIMGPLAERAVSRIEPEASRFWLALGDKILVFSYFPSPQSKISAWSFYEPGFVIDDMQRVGDRMFLRGGDTVYAYGGVSGEEYPAAGETPVEVLTPFMDGERPASQKDFKSINLGLVNEWKLEAAPYLNKPHVFREMAHITEDTFDEGVFPFEMTGSGVALRLTCEAAGPASLSRITVHYDEDEPE